MNETELLPGGLLAPLWSKVPPLRVVGAVTAGAATVMIDSSAGPLLLTLHATGVRLKSAIDPRPDYRMLEAEPAALPCRLRAEPDHSVVTGGGFEIILQHDPLAITVRQDGKTRISAPSDGHFVRQYRLPPFARTAGGWFVALELRSGESVYGLGEKWGRLDRRGQLVRSVIEDALGVNAEKSYKNVPFAWSTAGWGLLVHTASPVLHGVGFAQWSQRAYGLLIEDPVLDLFLLLGKDGAEILGHYAALTGRAKQPPLWSLGVILSRAYYKTPEEVLAVAAEVRRRRMPCDVITFDGRAWQDTDSRFAFEWDPKRFSDPAGVIRQLQAMNFRVCVWEYPLVSVNNPLFAEMEAKGWLLRDRRSGAAYRYRWDPEPFGAVLTPLPDSGLVDFTHPDAYAFWRDSHKALFDIGVDMIKADFGEQIEPDMLAANGETGQSLHNVYAHLYNRCVYEAAERYGQTGAFLFSRASWIGAQRYPAQWGGDPQADWEGMAANLRGGLSWGLSGAPFYATDVGGFYRDQRDPLLYVRWLQAAIFSAHIRLHGIGPREPWSYGSDAEAAADRALALRYRLLPYLRQALVAASDSGLPVQRAMALACPQERAAWAFDDQFFFGADMLVAPCLRADGEVEIYLPMGDWRRFPCHTPYPGGRAHRLRLALDEMAVFVPAGRRIPLGPEIQHCGEASDPPQISDVWQA